LSKAEHVVDTQLTACWERAQVLSGRDGDKGGDSIDELHFEDWLSKEAI